MTTWAAVPSMGMRCAYCSTSDATGVPWIGPVGAEGNWSAVFHNGPASTAFAPDRQCFKNAKVAGLVT